VGVTGFEDKLGETVNLGFEAKLRNPRSSSPCARCKSHTVSPDLPIVWPPSTWFMLDHPWSFAPSQLLLPRSSSLPTMSHLSPTQHETSYRDSSHETKILTTRFLSIGWIVLDLNCPEFKFKPQHVNDSTHIKPRYWPLDFSISSLMSPLITKSIKFEFWI
jgi:hypothetical protein